MLRLLPLFLCLVSPYLSAGNWLSYRDQYSPPLVTYDIDTLEAWDVQGVDIALQNPIVSGQAVIFELEPGVEVGGGGWSGLETTTWEFRQTVDGTSTILGSAQSGSTFGLVGGEIRQQVVDGVGMFVQCGTAVCVEQRQGPFTSQVSGLDSVEVLGDLALVFGVVLALVGTVLVAEKAIQIFKRLRSV